jgi:hypothetical protein
MGARWYGLVRSIGQVSLSPFGLLRLPFLGTPLFLFSFCNGARTIALLANYKIILKTALLVLFSNTLPFLFWEAKNIRDQGKWGIKLGG